MPCTSKSLVARGRHTTRETKSQITATGTTGLQRAAVSWKWGLSEPARPESSSDMTNIRKKPGACTWAPSPHGRDPHANTPASPRARSGLSGAIPRGKGGIAAERGSLGRLQLRQ